MDIDFDPAKSARNVAERGLDFDLVRDLDFATALYRIDNREDYGEVRWQALGLIGERVHVVVFAGTETGIRVISFRKANAREVKIYAQASQV